MRGGSQLGQQRPPPLIGGVGVRVMAWGELPFQDRRGPALTARSGVPTNPTQSAAGRAAVPTTPWSVKRGAEIAHAWRNAVEE